MSAPWKGNLSIRPSGAEPSRCGLPVPRSSAARGGSLHQGAGDRHRRGPPVHQDWRPVRRGRREGCAQPRVATCLSLHPPASNVETPSPASHPPFGHRPPGRPPHAQPLRPPRVQRRLRLRRGAPHCSAPPNETLLPPSARSPHARRQRWESPDETPALPLPMIPAAGAGLLERRRGGRGAAPLRGHCRPLVPPPDARRRPPGARRGEDGPALARRGAVARPRARRAGRRA